MSVVTWDSFRAAEHFTMRTARLIDRYRFAYHFQSGPTAPIRSALAAYRNIDGGYGNALDPDLRGHASQPLAVDTALRYLDELGPIPQDLGQGICRYLATTSPDGGLPPVTPAVRHTEAAPWWRERPDHGPDLALTASITGRLHKHNITHPWRDRATAYCWKHIDALHWTDPHEAIGICTFLQHVSDRPRALAAVNRLSTMIRAVVRTDPHEGASVPGYRRAASPRHHVHTPLDLAPDPSCIARPMFTDSEIAANLDRVEETQRPEGGWSADWDHWDATATHELEGMRTIQRLRILRAYGRLTPGVPAPRRDR